MTTVVTGASGTVGRSLVAQLLQAGEPVRALTRDPATARFPPGVEVVQGTWPIPPALGDRSRRAGPLPTVERLTGRPVRSFAAWAADFRRA